MSTWLGYPPPPYSWSKLTGRPSNAVAARALARWRMRRGFPFPSALVRAGLIDPKAPWRAP